METIISILTRFVANAVWCCAVVVALSLGCVVVWKWQNLAEGLKGEPKTLRAVFVAMLVAAATLFSKVDPNGAPPNLNAPLSESAPMLQIGAPEIPPPMSRSSSRSTGRRTASIWCCIARSPLPRRRWR